MFQSSWPETLQLSPNAPGCSVESLGQPAESAPTPCVFRQGLLNLYALVLYMSVHTLPRWEELVAAPLAAAVSGQEGGPDPEAAAPEAVAVEAEVLEGAAPEVAPEDGTIPPAGRSTLLRESLRNQTR